MKRASAFIAIAAALLASCASNKHGFEEPKYEIEVRDPQGLLSGINAQLSVASRPHPMESSARASTFFSEEGQVYRIESLLHDQRNGWLLASPNIKAPFSEVERYVFEFRFQKPGNPSSWSDWMPVTFLTIGRDSRDLIYKTGREERLPPPPNTGLQMRHRTTTWPERRDRQPHPNP